MTALELLKDLGTMERYIRPTIGEDRWKTLETLIAQPPAYRWKFTYDQDAVFEECNGKSEPLSKEEYATNVYRACPDHPRAGSDPANPGTCPTCHKGFEDIPYAEYLAYYGNPDRHVYLGCIMEKRCGCCGDWQPVGSLWGIDMMDNDPDYLRSSIDTWETSPDAFSGYLKSVAEELQADHEAEER